MRRSVILSLVAAGLAVAVVGCGGSESKPTVDDDAFKKKMQEVEQQQKDMKGKMPPPKAG